MTNKITVTVYGARSELFEDLFGTATVPVKSPIPVERQLDGLEEPELCYFLDLAALQKRQRDNLYSYLATAFNAPVDEVCAGLEEHGLPIRASETVCAIPFRLLI